MSRIGAYRKFGVGAIFALLLGLFPTALVLAQPNPTVGPGGGAGQCAEPAYATIQAAIDSPAAPATINVCAGTYDLTAPIAASRSITLVGSDARTTIIDGFNSGNAVQILSVDGDVTLSGMTLQNGHAANDGGAVYATGLVSVTNVAFKNNASGGGGAIYSWDAIAIANSTFSGNTAVTAGGAVYSYDAVTIANSTFFDNHSKMGGAVLAATLTIANSTFSGNASTKWGAVVATDLTLANTILANSTGNNCRGIVTDNGGNFSTDGSCGLVDESSHGNVPSGNLALAALANKGGQTDTMALGLGSVAINAGVDGICSASPVDNFDQRGFARPVAGHCDAGAFEAAFSGVTISPSESWIYAGDSQRYYAYGIDEFGNQLQDVSGLTLWEIDGIDSVCVGPWCGSTVMGSHTVRGTFGEFTDTASLDVRAGELDHIQISPDSATISAGGNQTYTAEGFDTYDNSIGDVTGATSFSIDGIGPCEVNVCSTSEAGNQTVRGNDDGNTATATLHVNPVGLARIVISPSYSSIHADGTQTYAAEGYDRFSNDLGSVTDGTTFDVDGNTALCTDNVCHATSTGDHTVGANSDGFVDSATLNVTPGALAYIEIAPSNDTIDAGQTTEYSALGFDTYSNARGDVTGDTTFSSSEGGSCDGVFCGSNTAGHYTITGTDGSLEDTADLYVNPAGLAYIVISPKNSTITTDGSKAYTVDGFDAYDNSLGDVTDETDFSIAAHQLQNVSHAPASGRFGANYRGGANCNDNVCRSTTPGIFQVTANDGGKTDTAILRVNLGAANYIVVTPSTSDVTTDATVTYTALVYDAHDNLINNVTADTTFGISAGGFCQEADPNVCGATSPGEYTVTGTYGEMHATASLDVSVGALTYILISPHSSTISADDSQTYTASSYDRNENLIGDVTAQTSFTIDGSDCSGATCRSTDPGAHTVVGTLNGSGGEIFDEATLHVNVGALAYIRISPSYSTVTADNTATYSAEGFDAWDNSLGDVTSDTTFSITEGGSCSVEPANVCSSTTVGDYTVTGNDAGKTDTADLHVIIGTLTSISISPPESSITTDNSETYTATGHDAHGNTNDVTVFTTFTIDGETTNCGGNDCWSTAPGLFTVTGTKGALTATADLQVTVGDLDYISLTPTNPTITAGGSKTFTVEAFDSHGNSRGFVTGATDFSIDQGASCADNVCTSHTPGTYEVDANYDGFTDWTNLHVDLASLDHIVISPSVATITAGGTQTYTAEGFDVFNNDRGDVTDETTFSIAGPHAAACEGVEGGKVCGSTHAGDYTVTGTDGELIDTADLQIDPAGLSYITISPQTKSITTDETQAYTAEGFDAYDNSRGDVTAHTSFSISIGGFCGAEGCGATTPGDYTVTGTDGELFDTAALTVSAGALSYIVIAPSENTITADETQAYTARGFDAHDNSLGDVTSDTTFSITAGGSCSEEPTNVCGSTTVGEYTVTGSDGGKTDTALLHVTIGALASIIVSPDGDSIVAGSTRTFSAEGFDAYGNRTNVTGDTTFTISGVGSCTGSACGSTRTGPYTVTGNDDGLVNTAALTVTAAPLYDILISPNTATFVAGGSQAYTAEGLDFYGNSRGDVTPTTTFTISGGGSCTVTVCTTTVSGVHIVTATKGILHDTSALHVDAGPLDHILISPSNSTITADDTQAYTATGFDSYDNSRGDVTSDTAFTASLGAGCTGTQCSSTVPGAYTITGTDGELQATATLQVSVGTLTHIVVNPDGDTITAGGTKTFSATGYDAYGNSLDVTSTTTFAIDESSCTGSVCGSTAAGDHTVTGTKGLLSDTATLHVTAGTLNHIVISPDGATITAGGSQAYTAEGFDSYSNTLGSVTGSTTFSIGPDGHCTLAVCSANVSGDHTVTGTKALLTDTATLHVDAGAIASIVVSPDGDTVAAGIGKAFTAEGFDALDNSLGDVTSSTTFSIGPNGSCALALCSSTVSGDHTVTGTKGLMTDTAALHVSVATVVSIVISPKTATINAGGNQAYTATGHDTYDNTIDVTGSTTFSVAGGGSCTLALCTSTVAGDHTVTASKARPALPGDALLGTGGSMTDTATLHVNAGPVHSIIVLPDGATITAGGSQAYTAEGYDFYSNDLGLVTDSTTFSIAGGGSCTLANCTSNVAGDHVITGTYSLILGGKLGGSPGASDTATLHVLAGPIASIVISPDPATITAGGSQAYTAEGFDAFSNDLGSVTDSTVFSIGPDGSCALAICTANVSGDHTVTGTKGLMTDTATLHVNVGALASIVISPDSASITAGGSQAYTAQGFDALSNSLGNITATTTFSIAPDGSCTLASCTVNLPGDHTVTGAKGGHQDTATLHVNVGPPHHFVVAGLPNPMIPSSTGTVTVTAVDSVGNVTTAYSGTAHFTSTDAAAVLPADYTFVAGDHGTHTFTLGVTLKTPGTRTVTATDTVTSSITGSQVGIVVGYSASTFHAIAPARVLDTRATSGTITNMGLTGTFVAGTVRTFQVANAHYVGGGSAVAVPAGATAVTGNLTVVNETAAGVLALGPTMTPTGAVTTLNFARGDILPNNVTIGLAADGSLQVVYRATAGARTDVIFDVTGYFTANTTGATYHLVAPGRVLDTRPTGGDVTNIGLTGKFQTGVVRTFDVTGVVGIGWLSAQVPDGAVAVTGNVTVANASAGGFVTVGPTVTSLPKTSTVNVKAATVRANGITVALSGGNLQAVFVGPAGSTADILFDVTGYFTADQTGLAYHAIVPARILDSATNVGLTGAFTAGTSRTMAIAALGQVDAGALGISGNLTLVSPSSRGYAFAAPSITGTPTSSTVNTTAGVTAANGFDVALDGTGHLVLIWIGTTGATANLQLDITGYWK
jgi:hypothetical protein